MTLVDTSVLLDVLVAGAAHGDASERRLLDAQRAGRVTINLVIAGELAPLFDREAALWETLAEAQVDLVPYPRAAIHRAGQAFLRYRRRGGRRDRILPDFLIGAHAEAEGARLLTRDRGFYRDYFPKLRLVP